MVFGQQLLLLPLLLHLLLLLLLMLLLLLLVAASGYCHRVLLAAAADAAVPTAAVARARMNIHTCLGSRAWGDLEYECKLPGRRNCGWLIETIIVYLVAHHYVDNHGNSKANTRPTICLVFW